MTLATSLRYLQHSVSYKSLFLFTVVDTFEIRLDSQELTAAKSSKTVRSMSSRLLLGNGAGPNTVNSEQIRIEVNRFEGIHPTIYNLYDMIQDLPDSVGDLRAQIRDQLLLVEAL
ncbi:unnamed protein product [Auanema sp. JU1783]|nr:unnamed protein product [Auanema sp. JU1783]